MVPRCRNSGKEPWKRNGTTALHPRPVPGAASRRCTAYTAPSGCKQSSRQLARPIGALERDRHSGACASTVGLILRRQLVRHRRILRPSVTCLARPGGCRCRSAGSPAPWPPSAALRRRMSRRCGARSCRPRVISHVTPSCSFRARGRPAQATPTRSPLASKISMPNSHPRGGLRWRWCFSQSRALFRVTGRTSMARTVGRPGDGSDLSSGPPCLRDALRSASPKGKPMKQLARVAPAFVV